MYEDKTFTLSTLQDMYLFSVCRETASAEASQLGAEEEAGEKE